MRVRQIGLEFRAVEDRLLLRIATDPPADLRYWLTRRYVRLMWEALSQSLERQLSADRGLAGQAREAVLAMERQARLQKTDFSQPFQSVPGDPAAAAPASAGAGCPLLVGLTIRPKGPDLWQVTFVTDARVQIDLNLNNDQILSLMALLQRTLAVTEWDLKLRGLDAVVMGEQRASGTAVH